ncbi:hypothetical protein pb186bvf_014022 [Paramecium bursaria]
MFRVIFIYLQQQNLFLLFYNLCSQNNIYNERKNNFKQ